MKHCLKRKYVWELLLNDGQISTMAEDYYIDESFCRNDEGNINLFLNKILISSHKLICIKQFF
jgi:hypothetical protein